MEPKKDSSVDDFFKNLPDEDKETADIFDEKKAVPLEETKKVEDDIDPEKAPESVKDRRHRRLEQRLQAERESNLVMAERLKNLSEMDRFAKDNGDEVDPRIAKMFNSDDIGKQNALVLSQVISENRQKAKEEALEEMDRKQVQAVEEQKKYESLIDNELESLEDEYNVDLTSDSPKARKARRELLELVERVSPKDESGEITGYADFGATYDMYRKSKAEDKVDNSRREEIADRSMKRSSANSEVIPKRTPGFNGWKQDIEKGII